MHRLSKTNKRCDFAPDNTAGACPQARPFISVAEGLEAKRRIQR